MTEESILNEQHLEVPPAPWTLTGMGFIIVFYGTKRIDPFSGKVVSGLGSMMVVRYDNSPVGPYNEVLYIPGRQKLGNKKGFFISKIYVDSQASVVGGRANWGLPKEFANIEILEEGGLTKVNIDQLGERIITVKLKPQGPRFPINTTVLPIPLVQHLDGKNYSTKFKGKGKARWCQVHVDQCDPKAFVDPTQFKILAVLAVNPFQLTFPLGEIY